MASGVLMFSHLANRDVTEFKFYHYNPNTPCAIVFAVAFTATTVWHIWQSYSTASRFMVPLVVGGLFELVGYCGRAVSGTESPDWTMGPYVIQNSLILLAPALIAASIYIELGRIIMLLSAEKYSLVSPKRMTKFFVTGDVLSFLIQAAGGQLMAMGGADGYKIGPKVVIGGLFCQLAFFGFFIGVAARFYLKARHNMDHIAPWQRHLAVLFTTSSLIMVRSVVRVAEYVQGFDGYILSHEAFLYVFDGTLMLAVMVLFNVFHPSQILRSAKDGGSDEQDMEQEKAVAYCKSEEV